MTVLKYELIPYSDEFLNKEFQINTGKYSKIKTIVAVTKTKMGILKMDEKKSIVYLYSCHRISYKMMQNLMTAFHSRNPLLCLKNY